MTASAISLLGGAVRPLVEQNGDGNPILLLHGGAGPASMRPLQGILSDRRYILPTHPGFDGTDRPAWLSSIADLSLCYLALLDALKQTDVLVVGNSAGGWIATEMALRRPTTLRGIVLIDAVGMTPTQATGPIIDPASVPPDVLASLAFANPAKATPPSPEAAERLSNNQRALNIYAGDPFMHDPTLDDRLGSIAVPTLILWGDADRIVTPAYGEAFAQAIPDANFKCVPNAGHMPQIERPDAVTDLIQKFESGILSSSQKSYST